MRTYIYLMLLLVPFSLKAQQNIDISKWFAYKVYMSGVNDQKSSDYVSRTLEKNQFAVMASFDIKNGYGYLMVEAAYMINEIEKYINNTMYGIRLENYEMLELTPDLFMDAYYFRGNVPIENKSKELPQFIQFGPYTQFSNDIYGFVKKYWIEKYPEAYKAMFKPSPLTPEQIEEQNQKLNRKN